MPRKKTTAAENTEVKETKTKVAETTTEAAAEKKTPAKKTTASTAKKATAAKKTTTTAKKTAAKKEVEAPVAAPAPKTEIFIEYNGAQVSVDEIAENAKKIVGNDKDIKIYVQPSTSKAYIAFGEETVAMDVYFC